MLKISNTSTRLIGCKKRGFIFDIIIIIIGSNKINGKISWHPNKKRFDELTSTQAFWQFLTSKLIMLETTVALLQTL